MKQPLETLPLEQFILLPFNHEDAVVVAGFDFKAFRQAGDDRQILKDDFKILGHAHARDYGFLITDDGDTMAKYCGELRRRGDIKFRAIKLQDGFSLEPFTPDGQADLGQVLEEEAAEYDVGEFRDTKL